MPVSAQTPAVSGAALYEKRCAACHDHAAGRIPPRATIQNMTAQRIMRTLDFGAMMTIAYTLRHDEREAVASYLGKPGDEAGPPPEAFCKDRSVTLATFPQRAWNGWSPSSDNARFVPAELARPAVDEVKRLKVKWAFGFDGDISAFAQPTIIDGQIFVGSAGGRVHALKADSGCLQWIYQATGPLRSAIVATRVGQKHVLLFGDLRRVSMLFGMLDPTTFRHGSSLGQTISMQRLNSEMLDTIGIQGV